MKIIHCADLHLDAKMNANLSNEQARERKTELLTTFTTMVEYASSNDVKVVLIAGDLFDTRNVSALARNTVRDAIISHPDIDFLYLKGNHDYDNFLSNLEEVPENLYLFSDDWKTYHYGRIAISGIELCKENQLTAYNSLLLSPEEFHIVTLHGQESAYGVKDKAEVIDLGSLKNKNIDYLALGHVHAYKREQLDARGIYCYCGCLEGRGFDECGPKGFVLLDIDEDTLQWTDTFVPIAKRRIYTVLVDATDCMTSMDALDCIEETICKMQAEDVAFSKDALVKFVLQGQVDVACELSTEFLSQRFMQKFYFAKVYDETKVFIDYSAYEKDASLKGEFIRRVMASDLSDEMKSDVIRCGIAALENEI